MLANSLLILSMLYKFNTVFSTDCFDESECYFSTITDDALCYGYRACYFSTINGTSVECAGKCGCGSASITTNGSVECSGDAACVFATISTDDDIECAGKQSCLFATMKADGAVDCTGYLGCGFADISATESISADGQNAVFYSNVTADYVYGYGYFSLALSTLDSDDLEEMSVSCYGDSGGYLAEFICRSDSECRLICRGNCCADMNYICLSNSTCSLLCDEQNGDKCPTQNISSSTQNDDKLIEYLVNKQNTKKHDKKYVEIKEEVKKTENMYNVKSRQRESSSLLSSVDGISVVSNGSLTNSSIFIASCITFIITFVMVYCWFGIKSEDHEYKPLLEN